MAERELPNEIPVDHSYMQDGNTRLRVLQYEEAGVYATENLATGDISYLGESQNPQAVEALFEMRNAQGADLEKIRGDLAHLNENPQLAQNLIDHRDHRQGKIDAYSKDISQKSFTQSDKMPEIDPAALHRQDSVDYSQADWQKINEAMGEYRMAGGDPTDIGAVQEHLREAGLSEEDQKWGRSLAEDPIQVEDGIFVNGRHRAHAMQEQGVGDIFFQDHDRLSKDPDYKEKIMAGKEAEPVSVDHMKNIKGVVYENENDLQEALRKEYGSSSPAQDLNKSQDGKYRLSVIQLEDGTYVGYGYDLKTGRTTVRGEYKSMKEAEQYARGTYANEVREAFSKHESEQRKIQQAEALAKRQNETPSWQGERKENHVPTTGPDPVVAPIETPEEEYLLDEWAPDQDLSFEEKMEQVEQKVRVTIKKNPSYKPQQPEKAKKKWYEPHYEAPKPYMSDGPNLGR